MGRKRNSYALDFAVWMSFTSMTSSAALFHSILILAGLAKKVLSPPEAGLIKSPRLVSFLCSLQVSVSGRRKASSLGAVLAALHIVSYRQKGGKKTDVFRLRLSHTLKMFLGSVG